MERIQMWFGAYADVTLTATQRLFVQADGTLELPTVATDSLGQAAVDISGLALATGVNTGNGGDFVVTGGGTITPV